MLKIDHTLGGESETSVTLDYLGGTRVIGPDDAEGIFTILEITCDSSLANIVSNNQNLNKTALTIL